MRGETVIRLAVALSRGASSRYSASNWRRLSENRGPLSRSQSPMSDSGRLVRLPFTVPVTRTTLRAARLTPNQSSLLVFTRNSAREATPSFG